MFMARNANHLPVTLVYKAQSRFGAAKLMSLFLQNAASRVIAEFAYARLITTYFSDILSEAYVD